MDATTTRTCAAPDCSAEFVPYRADHRYCSHACRWRAWRWREHGAAQRRPLYDSALKGADLTEVRSAAVSELVHGCLSGADQATMAKVAGLVVAVDRRLERPT